MFAALSKTNDAYVAYHHVAWLVPSDRGAPRQGEADFVVAHPKHGVGVVEVKGGAISYDAGAGRWVSGQHSIGDPFDQARRSSWVLVDALAQATRTRPSSTKVAYAVAFPDIRLRDVDLRLDAPREIVLDGDDIADLDQSLRRLFQFWRGKDEARPIDLGLLDRVLGKSFELAPPLRFEFMRARDDLLRLTEQQYDVLDLLAHQQRVAIGGCAGSGKTFLAAEKARRLASSGLRVLLLCYNLFLARYLREGLADVGGIDVLAFDELCEQIVREVRGALPPKHGAGYYGVLRKAFAEAAPEVARRYGALIVDEAQDFQADWWLPLQLLLDDPDKSPLYIFFDDNQRIFGTPKDLPVPGAPFVLGVNCRNTQSIHKVVSAYYAGGTISARGPEGLPVAVTMYKTRKQLLDLLDATVGEWRTKGGLEPGDIVLLTPHGRESSVLWWRDRIGGLDLTDDPWDRTRLLRASVYTFKGLERLVVGVVELDGASDRELYIAFSRPSLFLTVFCPESEQARIRGQLGRITNALRSQKPKPAEVSS